MRQAGDPVQLLVRTIAERAPDPAHPLLIALDGRSGAGKSTLARTVAAQTGAATIEGDDFYGGGTVARWRAMTAPEKVAHVIDWRRQREVLEALAQGQPATWYLYDWQANDGRLATEPVTLEPASIVILDGAYSARPELADLFAVRVLLNTLRDIRRAQLARREGDHYRAEWESLWSEAEDHYFGLIMPEEAFDLVLGS
ncbi:MAG TPA: (d)CMP kinase [Acidimicrobiales bacterium]|jgi:uridine kinase|nr:(d)CMP kinase [Acidimicrobiales bacterium]